MRYLIAAWNIKVKNIHRIKLYAIFLIMIYSYTYFFFILCTQSILTCTHSVIFVNIKCTNNIIHRIFSKKLIKQCEHQVSAKYF